MERQANKTLVNIQATWKVGDMAKIEYKFYPQYRRNRKHDQWVICTVKAIKFDQHKQIRALKVHFDEETPLPDKWVAPHKLRSLPYTSIQQEYEIVREAIYISLCNRQFFDTNVADIITQYSMGIIFQCCNTLKQCSNQICFSTKLDVMRNIYSLTPTKIYQYIPKQSIDNSHNTVTISGEQTRIFCEDCTNKKLIQCAVPGCDKKEIHYQKFYRGDSACYNHEECVECKDVLNVLSYIRTQSSQCEECKSCYCQECSYYYGFWSYPVQLLEYPYYYSGCIRVCGKCLTQYDKKKSTYILKLNANNERNDESLIYDINTTENIFMLDWEYDAFGKYKKWSKYPQWHPHWISTGKRFKKVNKKLSVFRCKKQRKKDTHLKRKSDKKQNKKSKEKIHKRYVLNIIKQY